jgi:hypothetical protein
MKNSHFTNNSASLAGDGRTIQVSGGKFNGTNLVFGKNKCSFGGAFYFDNSNGNF